VIDGLRRVRRLASVPALVALALLAVAGGASAQDPSPAPSTVPMPSSMASLTPGASAMAAIPVTLADFTVSPTDLVVGTTTVSFDVVNDGPTPHNLTIRDAAGTVLGATPDLSRGERATLTLTLPAAGSYITYCSLPGHESLGLKGTLTVAEMAAVSPSPAASVLP
jgi:uncharacterized cupredoxin-like copper-binding protein